MDETRTSSPRNYPTAEYAALSEGVALADFSHRTILRLTGKDPVGMLNAILTNDVPSEERRRAPEPERARADRPPSPQERR
jgi:glycine cleavage system aminomethyltransferase T